MTNSSYNNGFMAGVHYISCKPVIFVSNLAKM